MANSTLRSNIVAEDGTQQITGMRKMQADRMVCATLTATELVTESIISNTYVKATNYIQIGTGGKYLFAGGSGFSASIVAEATALVATPIKGSLYMGVGVTWVLNSDTTATKLD